MRPLDAFDMVSTVGNFSGRSAGDISRLSTGRDGAQPINQARGEYFETAFRRTMFTGAVDQGVVTGGTGNVATGLILSNPIGSPVNVSVCKATYGVITNGVVNPISQFGLMAGYSPNINVIHTTPVTKCPCCFDGLARYGYANLDTSATTPTSFTVVSIFGVQYPITSGLEVQEPAAMVADIDGSLVLPPGGYCAIWSSATLSSGAGASGMYGLMWEEIPI